MSLYLLNLRFDLTVANGLFDPYNAADPILTRSKTWLSLVLAPGEKDPDPNTFNPLDPKWTWTDSVGDDGGVTVKKGDTIGVHILPRPTKPPTPPPAGTKLRSTIVFGRYHKDQPFASPFTYGKSGNVATVFNEDFVAPRLSDGGWCFSVSTIAVAPPGAPNYVFDFLAAATLRVGGEEHKLVSFGHDPRMDVEV